MKDYVIKQAYFNTRKDAELLKIANSIENFSEWVKKCLRREKNEESIEDIVSRLFTERMNGLAQATSISSPVLATASNPEVSNKYSFDGFI